jgi:adenine C2-methylase RlmN of 23S rRNA A2503 and tRNA A37/CheY-like chemotaxis protein
MLVVDDHPTIVKGLKSHFQDSFDVVGATTAAEAECIASKRDFAVAIVDVFIRNENGIDLAKRLAKIRPNMGIVMYTSSPQVFYSTPDVVADACCDKGTPMSALGEIIGQVVWLRKQPRETRRIFQELQGECSHAISTIAVTGEKDVQRFDFRLRGEEVAALAVYTNPSAEEGRIIICPATTVGCIGHCKVCVSGDRPYQKQLSAKEILGEILEGLRSSLARSLFEHSGRLTVNFCGQGEPLSNLDNVCRVIEIMRNLTGIGNIEFIITTIGLRKGLEKFLQKYRHLCGRVKFYWSVNFLDERKRAHYMPGTRKQSLLASREILEQIAVAGKSLVTFSWVLIKGINDSDLDADQVAEFLIGRPFEVKVMALGKGSLVGVPDVTDQDVLAFAEKLRTRGLRVRTRTVLGGSIDAGCGSTRPRCGWD